jgi:sulfur carrier protein
MRIIMPDKSYKELHISETIIEGILKDLKINPVEVIVSRNGKVVSELDKAGNDDEIKIIKIVHGG